mgnify:CR=1 FL=1
MSELPFELYKRHKFYSLKTWRKRGVIFMGLEDQIYDIYIHSSECDRCKKKFKDSRDRKLDHDHLITDDFNVRGILCQNCNTINRQVVLSNTGELYISKIRIKRDGKKVLDTKRKTLEEAIELRDNFIKENPKYFK